MASICYCILVSGGEHFRLIVVLHARTDRHLVLELECLCLLSNTSSMICSVFCNSSLDANHLFLVRIVMHVLGFSFEDTVQQEELNIMHSYKTKTIAPRSERPL